jgi:hypothetical protein
LRAQQDYLHQVDELKRIIEKAFKNALRILCHQL